MIYGYARVSTRDQDHAGQVEALTAAGAAKVFSEKASGTITDRPQLKRAIAALDKGDVLLVSRIDRLARSTRDLLNVVHEVQARGATFRSLTETWVDTDSPTAKAMLTILGAVAELELGFIRARTAEGLERAKRRGVRAGRKPKLTAVQLAKAAEMIAEGSGHREIGELFDVSHTTIGRALARSRTGEPTA